MLGLADLELCFLEILLLLFFLLGAGTHLARQPLSKCLVYIRPGCADGINASWRPRHAYDSAFTSMRLEKICDPM